MAWGSYHSGGGRKSPSISQKKNVMISTHVRAVTHQLSSPYTKEKFTSPRRKFFMGIKFFLDQDSPGFTGTVCLEAKSYLGKGCKALWESVRGSHIKSPLQ